MPNLDQLPVQVSDLLETIEKQLNQQTFNGLPLLNLTPADIVEPLLTGLKDKVKQELETAQQKAKSEAKEFTSDLAQKALFTALQPILLDSTGEGSITEADILLPPDDPTSTQFKFKLGKQITENLNLADNIGLPSLGLDLKGGASATIDLSLNVKFGVENAVSTNPGFFVDISPTDDFKATIETKLKNDQGTPLAVTGSLGFLQVTATNNVTATDPGSEFKGTFTADFIGAAANGRLLFSELENLKTDPRLQADAALKFKVSTALNPELGINNGIMPSIGLDLNLLDWKYDSRPDRVNQRAQTDVSLLSAPVTSLPNVEFNNVSIDLGSVVNFAKPVLETTQKIAAPIADIARFLDKDLPFPKISLLDIAEQFGGFGDGTGDRTRKFVEQIAKITEFAANIPTGTLELGNFNWNGDKTVSKDDTPLATQTTALAATPVDTSWIDTLAADTGLNLKLLRSEGPTGVPAEELFKLLLGDASAQLVEYKTPQLAFAFEKTFPPDPGIPIFGPVFLQFFAGGGAAAQLLMRFDAQGLENFKNNGFKAPEDILYGLSIAKPTDRPFPDKPEIAPNNLSLFGEIGAKAGINAGIIQIQVGGGINLTASFNAKDEADGVTDGVTRIQAFADKPFCAFDASGAISLIIFGQVKLNLGFFKIKKRINIPPSPINLVEIKTDTDCESKTILYDQKPKPDPEMMKKLEGQGIIDRQGTDGDDLITLTLQAPVTQAAIDQRKADKANDPNSTLPDIDPQLFDGEVSLTGLDAPNRYANVQIVVINSGKGNDNVTMAGLISGGQLAGEEGDDTLTGGNSDDFLTGGSGNDILDGSPVNNSDGSTGNTAVYSDSPLGIYVNLLPDSEGYGTAYDGFTFQDQSGKQISYRDRLKNIQNIEGSNYDDTIIGDLANNNLFGAGGSDYLLGGLGDDVLSGGSGGRGDYLDGGEGIDTTTYLDSFSGVQINLSSQKVTITSPIDGRSTIVLAENSGQQGDASGDRLFNIENLHGSTHDDVLIGSDLGGIIDGFLGDDIILAGAGAEELNGNEGSDWLSYQNSTAGVQVRLAPPLSFISSARGGFAQGDKIAFVKDAENKDTPDSTFENLEGSKLNDVLEGDRRKNIIKGLLGIDSLSGLAGDDTLMGGGGADSLDGGENLRG